MRSDDFQIDIKQILQNKAGKKARFFPKFVINWLKRIAHETEINDFLAKEKGKTGVPWLWDCLDYLDIKLNIIGEENLPNKEENERYTFVSNHPLGGQDGISIGAILGKHYNGKITYILNDLLMALPGLAPLSIPINKTGNQNRDFSQRIDSCFASDKHIIMFPAGLCSRKKGQIIKDLPWKKTFIIKSVQHQRNIVPIYFSGSNSSFFYKIANIGKFLGFKFNIAMLFLVDEMYKNRHKTFTMKIGKPISWKTFDKSKTPTEWAKHVQDIVYNL